MESIIRESGLPNRLQSSASRNPESKPKSTPQSQPTQPTVSYGLYGLIASALGATALTLSQIVNLSSAVSLSDQSEGKALKATTTDAITAKTIASQQDSLLQIAGQHLRKHHHETPRPHHTHHRPHSVIHALEKEPRFTGLRTGHRVGNRENIQRELNNLITKFDAESVLSALSAAGIEINRDAKLVDTLTNAATRIHEKMGEDANHAIKNIQSYTSDVRAIKYLTTKAYDDTNRAQKEEAIKNICSAFDISTTDTLQILRQLDEKYDSYYFSHDRTEDITLTTNRIISKSKTLKKIAETILSKPPRHIDPEADHDALGLPKEDVLSDDLLPGFLGRVAGTIERQESDEDLDTLNIYLKHAFHRKHIDPLIERNKGGGNCLFYALGSAKDPVNRAALVEAIQMNLDGDKGPLFKDLLIKEIMGQFDTVVSGLDPDNVVQSSIKALSGGEDLIGRYKDIAQLVSKETDASMKQFYDAVDALPASDVLTALENILSKKSAIKDYIQKELERLKALLPKADSSESDIPDEEIQVRDTVDPKKVVNEPIEDEPQKIATHAIPKLLMAAWGANAITNDQLKEILSDEKDEDIQAVKLFSDYERLFKNGFEEGKATFLKNEEIALIRLALDYIQRDHFWALQYTAALYAEVSGTRVIYITEDSKKIEIFNPKGKMTQAIFYNGRDHFEKIMGADSGFSHGLDKSRDLEREWDTFDKDFDGLEPKEKALLFSYRDFFGGYLDNDLPEHSRGLQKNIDRLIFSEDMQNFRHPVKATLSEAIKAWKTQIQKLLEKQEPKPSNPLSRLISNTPEVTALIDRLIGEDKPTHPVDKSTHRLGLFLRDMQYHEIISPRNSLNARKIRGLNDAFKDVDALLATYLQVEHAAIHEEDLREELHTLRTQMESLSSEFGPEGTRRGVYSRYYDIGVQENSEKGFIIRNYYPTNSGKVRSFITKAFPIAASMYKLFGISKPQMEAGSYSHVNAWTGNEGNIAVDGRVQHTELMKSIDSQSDTIKAILHRELDNGSILPGVDTSAITRVIAGTTEKPDSEWQQDLIRLRDSYVDSATKLGEKYYRMAITDANPKPRHLTSTEFDRLPRDQKAAYSAYYPFGSGEISEADGSALGRNWNSATRTMFTNLAKSKFNEAANAIGGLIQSGSLEELTKADYKLSATETMWSSLSGALGLLKDAPKRVQRTIGGIGYDAKTADLLEKKGYTQEQLIKESGEFISFIRSPEPYGIIKSIDEAISDIRSIVHKILTSLEQKVKPVNDRDSHDLVNGPMAPSIRIMINPEERAEESLLPQLSQFYTVVKVVGRSLEDKRQQLDLVYSEDVDPDLAGIPIEHLKTPSTDKKKPLRDRSKITRQMMLMAET